jgi:tetratricopeptide (TPR) repeat protein
MTVGDSHLSVANTLHCLGYVCDAQNEPRDAMKYHKEGLNVRKVNLGKNHVLTAASLDDVAGMYQKVGENEKALQCLKEALRIRKLQLVNDSMDIATTLFAMGIVFAASNDNEKASECYSASLAISARNGSNPKLEAQTLHQIGVVNASRCLYREALQSWRTSLSKYREAGLADDHYLVTCTLGNLEVAENVIAGN